MGILAPVNARVTSSTVLKVWSVRKTLDRARLVQTQATRMQHQSALWTMCVPLVYGMPDAKTQKFVALRISKDSAVHLGQAAIVVQTPASALHLESCQLSCWCSPTASIQFFFLWIINAVSTSDMQPVA